jgi:glycosyltransferase involved in cell wall biosynthesis
LVLPKVSCYCATYGRPWALEEALESFLLQDYEGEKELIILNDYSGHQLRFEHPEVRIVNVTERITPLGKKFNETVKLCTGDVLFPWEDDDVYLPNKVSYSIAHLKNGFFHTHLGFMELDPWGDQSKLKVGGNYFHCNIAVTRELWEQAGGYVEIDQSDLDVKLMTRLKELSKFEGHDIPPAQIFYVYRWGTTNSFHASGWGCERHVRASNLAQNIVDAQAKQGIVPQGEYILKPRWNFDYIAEGTKAAQIFVP